MRIELDQITLLAGNRELFQGISWTIHPGQTWAILGPTGAGKSVLIAALSRRLPINKGEVRYVTSDSSPKGRPFLHPGEVLTFSAETHRAFIQRFAGYVQARWQSLEGDDNPLVSDYLLATVSSRPGSHHPVIISEANLAETVRLLAIEPLLDRQIHRLSNGESRKVFLAHLLLSSPRFLILDDPFNGLDARSRMTLAAAIEALIAHGTPQVLFATSRPEDLPDGITHILGVNSGQVVSQGPRAAILNSAGLATIFAVSAPGLSPTPNILANPLLSNAIQSFTTGLNGRISQYPPELIEMRDVSVTYDRVRVLQTINWTVRQGERWLVSGPNGSGKTSLLSLVLADNPQSYANPVTLFGRRRGSGESIWAVKRAIGWVSPELQAFYTRPNLDHPSPTCLQVVCSGFFDSVGLFHTAAPDQKTAALEWLAALGLEGFSEQPFQRLSNGQQRLALLARALVKHPPLLVLDEPCQALDAEHRQIFTVLVDALCTAAPLTLLYVTHDPAEYPACITHRLRLEQGEIVENGPIRLNTTRSM